MALTRKPTIQGTYGSTSDAAAAESRKSATSTAPEREPETAPAVELATVTELTPHSEPVDQPGEGHGGGGEAAEPPAKEEAPAAPQARSAKPAKERAQPQPPARRKEPLRNEAQRLRDDRKTRDAVEAAFMSARRSPSDWGTAPVRISELAKERLADRRGIDADRFGVDFAETHYLEAAMSAVPEDADAAMEWVDAYLKTLGLQMPDTVGTTSRLRKTTAERFKTVSRTLRRKHGFGKIGHLQTAALIRLLDSLDRLDVYEPDVVNLDEV